MILRRGDRNYATYSQDFSPILQYGGSRLNGVAAGPKLRQKRKANIDVRQSLPLQQSADSDGSGSAFQLHQIEPEAESFIAGNWSILNVSNRVLVAPDAPVANVLNK